MPTLLDLEAIGITELVKLSHMSLSTSSPRSGGSSTFVYALMSDYDDALRRLTEAHGKPKKEDARNPTWTEHEEGDDWKSTTLVELISDLSTTTLFELKNKPIPSNAQGILVLTSARHQSVPQEERSHRSRWLRRR